MAAKRKRMTNAEVESLWLLARKFAKDDRHTKESRVEAHDFITLVELYIDDPDNEGEEDN